MSRKWLWVALTLIGPVAAIGVIWLPLFGQYHVDSPDISPAVLAAANEPIAPEVRSLLEERSGGLPVAAPEGRAVSKADRLIASGELQLGAFPKQSIELPFAPENLHRGSVTWRFHVAALVVPRLFLDAYRESGNRRYLEHARASILAWARFEQDQWLPQGLLWNDHALAIRIRVLALAGPT